MVEWQLESETMTQYRIIPSNLSGVIRYTLYNLPHKHHEINTHMEKLEQTIGFGKQSFLRLHLAS